jgi:hypothetical protein
MENYQKQANKFAKKTGLKLSILESDYKSHFAEDKKSGVYRWVFKCRLSVGKKSYTFDFGQSIANGGEEPNLYDILSCLEKYGYEDFEDFCSNLGYDSDSRTAEKTFKAVQREYTAICRLFTSEQIEELREIQ